MKHAPIILAVMLGVTTYTSGTSAEENRLEKCMNFYPQRSDWCRQQYPDPTGNTAPAATANVANEAATEQKERCEYGSRCEIVEQHIGCQNEATMDRLAKFKRQGDQEAFVNGLTVALVADECRRFEKGESVYRERGVWPRVCLRPAGQQHCYWTVREGIGE